MSKERELLRRLLTSGIFESGMYEDWEQYIKELLAQPEQEAQVWIATNGKEPRDWEEYEYIWTHWKSGRISLDEAYGCWTWEDITYWMPANIIEPSKPR